MIIQIDKLKDNEKLNLDFNQKLTLSSDFDVENYDVLANFKGTFSNEKDYFKLEGRLNFDISINCARCLTPVTESIDIEVFELFKNSNGNFEDVESDDNFYYFETLEVDLSESLLINIQLHIPTMALCNDDCKGLCQYCGIDLNHSTCSCEKPIDSRWEALKSLLDNE